MRRDRQQTADDYRHLTSQQIGHRSAGALVLDGDHLDLRHAREQFRGEMGGAAETGAGIAQAALRRAGQRDQFLDRLRRQRRMHGQHEWRVAKLCDRDDAIDRIESRSLHGRRRREAARHHHDRVAVRRRFRGLLHSDQPACAAAVIDDELLTEILGEFVRELAGGDVAAAAGSEWHNHTHGLGWILLRLRSTRDER